MRSYFGSSQSVQCVCDNCISSMGHTKQYTNPERGNKRKVIIHTIWSEERRSFHWQWMKERFVIRISSFLGRKYLKWNVCKENGPNRKLWLISHGTCTFPCLAHTHTCIWCSLNVFHSFPPISLPIQQTNDNTYTVFDAKNNHRTLIWAHHIYLIYKTVTISDRKIYIKFRPMCRLDREKTDTHTHTLAHTRKRFDEEKRHTHRQ